VRSTRRPVQLPAPNLPELTRARGGAPWRRFIKCGVCQELTKALVKDVKELRESKGNKARRRSYGNDVPFHLMPLES